MDGLTVVVVLLMLVGLIGIIMPVLPGPIAGLGGRTGLGGRADLGFRGSNLSWLGGPEDRPRLALSGLLLQYIVPDRRLRTAGVTTTATMAGAALAVVGFFVIPRRGRFPGIRTRRLSGRASPEERPRHGVVVDQARDQGHSAEHRYRAGDQSDDCCHLGGCRRHDDLTNNGYLINTTDQSGGQRCFSAEVSGGRDQSLRRRFQRSSTRRMNDCFDPGPLADWRGLRERVAGA